MRRKTILMLAVTIALLASSPASPAEMDLTKLVKKIQPAVTTIITYDKDKKVLGQGTGFFINKKGHLVSNLHVFKGAYSAEVKTFDGKVYPINSVVSVNEDVDLIKVSVDIPDKAVEFVEIARTIPQVAERVLVVGSPMGLEQTVTEGIVSAVREIASVGKILQLSAAISPGSSGSPVVNMKNEVVGVATFQLVKGQNLNFAVCSEQILALKPMAEAKSLAEYTSGFPDLEPQIEAITDIAVGGVAVPDDVQIVYERYDATKKQVEELEVLFAKNLKIYQPTSKALAKIRERLKQAKAELAKVVEDRKEADKIMCQLLEKQIKTKQAVYDELIKELLPSAPQAIKVSKEIDKLRQRREILNWRLDGKQSDGKTNSIGGKLVFISPGEFMMGSNNGDFDETPVHPVKITKGFWMGQTEVTQGQYKAVMNAQPWSGKRSLRALDNNPAVNISWDEAVEFCKKLSKKEGVAYRLPTEAEWEYACRAGTQTQYSFGDSESLLSDHAWLEEDSWLKEDYRMIGMHAVAQKKPNPWGIYDMHGNVWEWCSDWYGEYSSGPAIDPKGPATGSYRVIRGGEWLDDPQKSRSASRWKSKPVSRLYSRGFRIVVRDF